MRLNFTPSISTVSINKLGLSKAHQKEHLQVVVVVEVVVVVVECWGRLVTSPPTPPTSPTPPLLWLLPVVQHLR